MSDHKSRSRKRRERRKKLKRIKNGLNESVYAKNIKRDKVKDRFLLLCNTLQSILNNIPMIIIHNISAYANGSIFKCSNCNKLTHIICSDNQLKEENLIKAIKETGYLHMGKWLKNSVFDYYLDYDEEQKSQIFFCKKCVLYVKRCDICSKFDISVKKASYDIYMGNCRRYHPLIKCFTCCGCNNDISMIKKPSQHQLGEEYWCMKCDGYSCKKCEISCYCDYGYCSFRNSVKCFKFTHLFQHIFHGLEDDNVNAHSLSDRDHINNVDFGDNAMDLHNKWIEMCRYAENESNIMVDKFEQAVKEIDKTAV